MDRSKELIQTNPAIFALDIASYAHAGAVDKQGKPYIQHPKRVGKAVAHLGEKYEAVGYLHDVVEDTHITLEILRNVGFSEEVIRAVDAVSRREGETYREFVFRAKEDPIGKVIKRADIEDNMRPGATESLYERYRQAIGWLEDGK